MSKRQKYDLTHQIHTCGKIGRLQTLGTIPVVAGDGLDIKLNGAFRLAPTRKEIVQDAKIDVFVFYRPTRHTYGDDWVNLIKEGPDVTQSGITTVSRTADGDSVEYLGLPVDSANIRRDLLNGYWDIYNWYFKNPDDGDTSLTKIPTGDEERAYGTLISRLPHPMTRPRDVTSGDGGGTVLNDSDFEVSSTSVLDIRDLAEVRAEARSEMEGSWYGQRYPDIMEAKYGVTVSPETDERPTLIFRTSSWASGRDLDGLDDATMGQIQGKTISPVNINIPRKTFKEHGLVWIMAAVRFPTVHVMEQVYPLTLNPSYDRDVGDPMQLAQQRPTTFAISNYIQNGSDFANHQEPANQHYRYHPSRIHKAFREIPGYPFLETAWSSADECFYHQEGDYDDVFQTWQLGHWSMSLLADVQKYTVIPGVDASIKTGT